MRHLCLHLICVFMVCELEDTLNKEVVIVHYDDLELWVDKAQ